MKTPFFWGVLYAFMGSSFVYFAINQNDRNGSWDAFTIALMAIAAYDFMIAIKYLTYKPKKNK